VTLLQMLAILICLALVLFGIGVVIHSLRIYKRAKREGEEFTESLRARLIQAQDEAAEFAAALAYNAIWNEALVAGIDYFTKAAETDGRPNATFTVLEIERALWALKKWESPSFGRHPVTQPTVTYMVIECEGMSARWGSVPPEVLDKVLDFAESLAGKPDTIA